MKRWLPLLLLLLAGPAWADTEITSLPVTLSIDGETYYFAPNDSTAYESASDAITVTGNGITLHGNNHLVTRTSTSNELLVVNGAGFRCDNLRSRNFRNELNGSDMVFDRCIWTNNTSGTLSTLILDGATDVMFYRCIVGSGTTSKSVTLTGVDAVTFESCRIVSYQQGPVTIDATTGDVDFINCTIVGQGTHSAIETAQTSTATLDLYSTVLHAENDIVLSCTDAGWSGLTAEKNWYYRESGTILITYQGTNYSDAAVFEAGSRQGDPSYVNDDDSYTGDYAIAAGGGPIDRGWNDTVTLATDVIGQPRIRNAIVDMGAYEYQPDGTGKCCCDDGSCVITTEAICTAGGCVWSSTGTCTPNTCPQPGACCVGTVCTITLFTDCAGDWQGAGTVCSPNPCAASSTGSCCESDGTCSVTTASDCSDLGGVWTEGGTCSPNLCDDFGACCVGQTCSITTPYFCAGDFQGAGSTCNPDPCIVVGCPPSGYTEISSFPLVLGSAQTGNKYAICGDLVIPWDAPYQNAIQIGATAHDIEINGFGQGSIRMGPGADNGVTHTAIRQYDGSHGVLVKDIDFDMWDSSGYRPVWVNGDSLIIQGCYFYGWQPHFEPKITDPDGLMTASGIVDCSGYFPGIGATRTEILPMGAGNSFMVDCFVDGYYLNTVDNPTYDGVGMNLNRWRGGYVRNAFIIVNDYTQTVEPIKAINMRDWILEDSYTYSPNGSFVSIRGNSDLDPTTHSTDCIIRYNRFLGGWKALNIDADSTKVYGNVAMGGFAGGSGGYIFRVSNTPDSLGVENNVFVATSGDACQWNCVGLNGVHVTGNTFVIGGTASRCLVMPGDDRTGILENNIFAALNQNGVALANNGTENAIMAASGNLFYRAGSGTLIAWDGTNYTSVAAWNAATGYGATSIGANPLFTVQVADTVATNFRLRDTSPAIDFGDSTYVSIGVDADSLDRIVGDNVDMGAYEFGSVVPTLNGACCFDDGSCSVTTEAACGSLGGAYQGDNTVCSPNPCPEPTGACCYNDGTCTVETEADCATAAGAYQGNDVTCIEAACEGSGACCYPDGSCVVTSETTCAGTLGVYQGNGTGCSPNPCPEPTGACCVGDSCYVLTPTVCVDDSSGTYQGDAVACADVDCTEPDPVGACCYLGLCVQTTEANCTGTWREGVPCHPASCIQPNGACCIAGECSEITRAACLSAGGIWYGALAECADVTCPQPLGACCLAGVIPAGVCVITTEASCDSASGSWSSGTACASANCDQYGVVTGGTRVITGTSAWVSSFGADTNHSGADIRLNPVATLGGRGVIRFDLPAGSLPANAIVTDARVETHVASTSGTPGDLEVYSLQQDPVMDEVTWNEYASGQSWHTAGASSFPHDRTLPAIGDQLGTGATAGDTLIVAQGPLAREWVWSDLLPDRTASLLLTLETGAVTLDGDSGPQPPRLILTYSLLVNRRRTAVLHQMEK